MIAKMDATANDLPPSAGFSISSFPTLKFKPAGTRDFVDYKGDRSLESLIEFIKANSNNPIEEAATTEKTSDVEAEEIVGGEAEAHDEL